MNSESDTLVQILLEGPFYLCVHCTCYSATGYIKQREVARWNKNVAILKSCVPTTTIGSLGRSFAAIDGDLGNAAAERKEHAARLLLVLQVLLHTIDGRI